jgi:hypothetical protein
MRNVSRFALGLTVVAALAASALPTEAACIAARAIHSGGAAVVSPGAPHTPNADSSDGCYADYGTNYVCGGTLTYLANGIFWAWGAGNPTVGLGADHGTNKGDIDSNWLFLSYYPYNASIGGQYGHWQFPGTDGCITETGSSSGAAGLPDNQECMVVVIEDLNGPNASFLAMSTPMNGATDFEFSPNTGFPAQLNLAPTPRPVIISSSLAGPNVNLTVGLPVGSTALTRANGFDFKCHGNPGEILIGYKIYSRQWPGAGDTTVPAEPKAGDSRAVVPEGSFPPTPPWVLRSGPDPVAIGANTSFSVPCNGGNVALCATLAFGGPSNAPGAAPWELKYCSQSSTTVTCDPTLANPGDKPKLGRKSRDTAPTQDRSTPKR